METERRRIAMPDGRSIEVLIAGPPDGLPLVLHEGTPVGLVLYPPTVQAAGLRGLNDGQKVTYEVTMERGKAAATNLKVV